MEPRDDALDRLCAIAQHRTTLRGAIKAAVAARNDPPVCEDFGFSVRVKVPGAETEIIPAITLGAAALNGIIAHLHDHLATVEAQLIDSARNLKVRE